MPKMPVGSPNFNNDQNRQPRPKSLREVPHFLAAVCGQFFGHLGYIFKLVWDSGKWITLAMITLAVLQGFLPVVTAFVGAKLLNALALAYQAVKSAAAFDLALISALLIVQFVCIFINNILGRINTMLTRIAGELVSNHVTVMLMDKAKEIDLQSYDKPDFYGRLENAQREAGLRPLQILNATFSAVTTLISMVSFFAILCTINVAAPFLLLLLALPSTIVSFVFRKKNFAYVRFRSKDRRQLAYYTALMTNKDMAKEIRIFGLSDELRKRYDETFKQYYKGLRKIYISEGLWNILVSLGAAVVNCVLFFVVAKMVMAGKIMVGDYSLYTGALNSLAGGVTTFIAAISTIYEGTLFIDNLITFMKEKKSLVSVLKQPRPVSFNIPHTIELKNVSFKYPGTDRYVIQNLSTTINSGSTVVLVGLNGAGKTTLIKLITRLYDPTEGTVLLDGHDIREYEPDEVYRLFGIIFQDFGKYAVSAESNIAFGQIDKPLNREEIVRAAVEGNADAFIDRLPKGYDTPLTRFFDDDGIELSIGQWQKLSISRAFYSNSEILILDEPTASLDAIAEQQVFKQFDQLRKDKTSLFVSHRLSSATMADNILVLENGQLIEQGDHQTLMAKKGTYYNLFTAQAERYLQANDNN